MCMDKKMYIEIGGAIDKVEEVGMMQIEMSWEKSSELECLWISLNL